MALMTSRPPGVRFARAFTTGVHAEVGTDNIGGTQAEVTVGRRRSGQGAGRDRCDAKGETQRCTGRQGYRVE